MSVSVVVVTFVVDVASVVTVSVVVVAFVVTVVSIVVVVVSVVVILFRETKRMSFFLA